jgi:hypothetical protein
MYRSCPARSTSVTTFELSQTISAVVIWCTLCFFVVRYSVYLFY